MYAIINTFPLKQKARLTDNETIRNFQTLLKKIKETWESVYIDKDTNHMFNSFLCTFLNTFQANFPVKHNSLKDKNDWITHGKKISCKHKRGLNAFNTNSIDPKAKVHYIKYSKMLRKVITEVKKPHYSRLIGKKIITK